MVFEIENSNELQLEKIALGVIYVHPLCFTRQEEIIVFRHITDDYKRRESGRPQSAHLRRGCRS
jgi:hypothetical protein